MQSDAKDVREIVVPLHAEEISVSKRVAQSGRVQVSTITRQHEQVVDELLAREAVEIERTPIGSFIDAMPAVREEGATIIIPIVEEVLVVERRLLLKEEVRVRRTRGTERRQERVMLRKQEAVVKRLPAEEKAAASAAAARTTTSEDPTNEGKEERT